MQANEREDGLYENGKRCNVASEEEYMISLLGECNSESDKTLLDLGCGSGEVSIALKELGFSPYGLDFSSVAIDISKKAGLNCQQVDLDQGIPFKDGQYSVVWAGDVMEHVFDPIGVFKEASRVLKKDGSMYATIPNDLNYKTRIRILLGQSYQEPVYKKFGQYKHHSFFSERLIRYMYGEAGLKINKLVYHVNIPIINYKFFTTFLPLRIFAFLFIIEAVKS